MSLLTAPVNVCIYRDGFRGLTMKFFERIDALYLSGVKSINLDLSNVQNVSAAASVIFFAKVNRIQLRSKNPNFFKFKWPNRKKNLDGYNSVIRTGLSKALLAGDLGLLDELDEYYQSSVEPYKQVINTVASLYEQAPLTDEQLDLLISAVSEATLNVSHHAYEEKAYETQVFEMGGKRWWQCSWYDAEDNVLVFIIYDVGVGLGRSFQRGDVAFSQMNELNCVLTALTVGQSRFRNVGRGNGSEDIKRPIGSGCADSESLLILTGNAKYSYTSVKQIVECEPVNEFFQGTLIEWSLVPRSA